MRSKKRTKILVLLLAGVLLLIAYVGVRTVPKILKWRHLDANYAEAFLPPAEIAPGLAGKRVLFHVKTGLNQDDSQICVGFNVIFAALEAGSEVDILFDAGALLDLVGQRSNLERTGVPVRLKKVIAAQMNLPLEDMPQDYGQYLVLLNKRGARVFANTAMNIVTGSSEQVMAPLPSFSFVQPAPYAQIAQLIAAANTVVVY